MGKDIITAARVIAERHMVGLKVEDIKEVMVSAMLEYAELRERKQDREITASCSSCIRSESKWDYKCDGCTQFQNYEKDISEGYIRGRIILFT